VFTTGTVPPDAIVSPASDRDHDGVLDVSDNCPDSANADQTANEDADGFGDACDLCPQLAGSVTTDGDGDRIGDACDPNPGAPDSVWMFESFHKGQPAWAGSTQWAPIADQLRVTALGDIGGNNEYLIVPLTSLGRTFDNVSITVPVLAEQMTGSSGDHAMGVQIYDENQDKSLYCDLYQSNGGANSVLVLADDNVLDNEPPFTWTANVRYTLKLVRRGSSYTCSVNGPSGTPVATTTGMSTVVPRSGAAVEIWAFGVTAQFASVFVVGP